MSTLGSSLTDHEPRLAGHGLCKFCVRTVLMMINRGKLGNNHEKGGGLTFYIKNGGNQRKTIRAKCLGIGSRLAQGLSFEYSAGNFSYETFFSRYTPFFRVKRLRSPYGTKK